MASRQGGAVFVLWILCHPLLTGCIEIRPKVYSMSAEKAIDIKDGTFNENVFCYKGIEPAFYYYWTSTVIKLIIDPKAEYSVYYGDNATAVLESIQDAQSSWFYTKLPWKSRDVKVHPFRPSCVGVITEDSFSMLLRIYRINYWQVCMTLMGFAGFLTARSLSRNAFFHYATSITVGVLFSFIALTYFFQRRFGLSWSSWIIALYSISLYFLTSILSQAQAYILQHHLLVLSYVAITAIVSAAITYRFGPVSNPRTLNLIQWVLQALSLTLIYLSSYYQTLSFTICVLLVLCHIFPLSCESEYMDQSRVVTEKALQDLREFCNSPECKPWKTMRALSSPSRFAEFIDGGSHLTQDEVIEYSHAVYDGDDSYTGSQGGAITDDDSDGEIDLGED
ncbi:unnamed protein product [Lepeophtheirus salmonis]|uniref:(salmon louse) hypothetical protein n=1 Tax=Lepeophtheirus salmonis TaxID=72036 RepID=A0A7R8GZG9_LEPSM|nr:unnamed protein product [Lepeophtheirus salmonis]CAF2765912.1 unnamed protein product [Lepeophtheirus salmonis]